MAKKAMTAGEKRHIEKVRRHGCIIPDCRVSPAEAHHPRDFAGAGQKSPHFLVIPLCTECHRGAFSIHANKRQFTAIHGSEAELLARTLQEIYGS